MAYYKLMLQFFCNDETILNSNDIEHQTNNVPANVPSTEKNEIPNLATRTMPPANSRNNKIIPSHTNNVLYTLANQSIILSVIHNSIKVE